MIGAPARTTASLPTRPPAAEPPARVMICDDSAVIRGAINNILRADPAIEVVVRVANGRAAVDALKQHDVDVVVLDIEMPVMDGLTALPLLLAASPGISVIMASTLTERGAEISMRALRLGAADYLPKPSANGVAVDQHFGPELIAKVKGLARLRRSKRGPARGAVWRAAPSLPHTSVAAASALAVAGDIRLRPAPAHPPQILAIGSSTGGPNALFALVQSLGPNLNIPCIITQHMPATFTAILAQHIDKLGILPCKEARDGDPLLPGRILLAPGNRHMLIRRHSSGLVVQLSDSPPENFCRPAVDPMLRSACEAVNGRVLAVILTGMGQDGLLGARQVVEAGGALVAQDEASSVVWGMPGAVAKAGLAHAVLPLPQIGPKLMAMIGGSSPRAAGARA